MKITRTVKIDMVTIEVTTTELLKNFIASMTDILNDGVSMTDEDAKHVALVNTSSMLCEGINILVREDRAKIVEHFRNGMTAIFLGSEAMKVLDSGKQQTNYIHVVTRADKLFVVYHDDINW